MDYTTLPIDDRSRQILAESGLQLELVDTADDTAFRVWLEVESRGFHQATQTPEELTEAAEALAMRRTTAVFDGEGARRDIVGTVNSWPVDLTVPGGSTPAWAISGVTVAATHRRRGIARALLESELRTASALGLPLATLTVSEATIYGRFGFAPAVKSVDLSIDTRRARWTGRPTSGQLRFVPPADLVGDAELIGASIGKRVPGTVTTWPKFYERTFAATPASAERAKKIRAVRYDDEKGVAQGYVVFSISHDGEDFARGVLDIEILAAATDEAYAALWRFALDMDLVATVKAPLRSIDEPLLWQVSDVRAVHSTSVRDHLWTRILDVESALTARRYHGPARILLDVVDDLGFANGRFSLAIGAEGVPSVTRLDDGDPAADPDAHLSLPVSALSALYLGGISASPLAAAGVVQEVIPGSAAVVSRAFASEVTPYLRFWF